MSEIQKKQDGADDGLTVAPMPAGILNAGREEPASYETEAQRFEQMQDAQLGSTGEVDAAAFVKAQSEFLRVQTWFLTHGSEPGSLVKYSLAQGAFIEAQRLMLEQLGVV